MSFGMEAGKFKAFRIFPIQSGAGCVDQLKCGNLSCKLRLENVFLIGLITLLVNQEETLDHMLLIPSHADENAFLIGFVTLLLNQELTLLQIFLISDHRPEKKPDTLVQRPLKKLETGVITLVLNHSPADFQAC